MDTKTVKLRMPIEVMKFIAAVAKAANVTPTQVYNVLLAMYVVSKKP